VTKVLLAAALAVVVAGGAWAVFLRSTDGHPIWVGALEDSYKQPDPAAADAGVALVSGAGFNALGMTTAWTPGQAKPSTTELTVLRNVVAAAERRKIQVLLSIYAPRSRYAPSTDAAQQEFASYAATLARDLPYVRDFVVWNEPNLNGFWLPQFDASGKDVAAPAYTSLLARTYDALKAVSPRIIVVGGSLAPRGADNPNSPRHTQSPTAFIRDMGRAYRASARTKPIMDLFAIHPYLNKSSIPPTQDHPTGTTLGIADYDKLVRLLGEGFDGTAQPGSKLRIAYTEFGVQTTIPPGAVQPYTNLQSPLGLDAVPEVTQADYYRQALHLATCQSNVAGILFFHTRDEPDLNRWQSGLYYADGRPKTSLAAVKEASLQARKGQLGSCP
jgi:hypothetical protein